MTPRLIGLLAIVSTFFAGRMTAFAHDGSKLGSAAPSNAQITGRLRHTIEIGTRGEYFRRLGKPLTILDGRGTGTLTAVIGGRYPTADGLGQIVFFWHNTTFIGLSSNYETVAVVSLKSPTPGTFIIKYAQYRPKDPVCCPSLPPRAVTYRWSGHILISNGVPPKGIGKPPRVTYKP
ncbi:MAG TPA: LppP/LprE family lipoprotein [Chloroflexota bacterium]